uniref:Uncharacterized protein n=1 Tax=Rhizophora mucronata TaxID=61149 RepID=A0A2P2NW65_RHIMU
MWEFRSIFLAQTIPDEQSISSAKMSFRGGKRYTPIG